MREGLSRLPWLLAIPPSFERSQYGNLAAQPYYAEPRPLILQAVAEMPEHGGKDHRLALRFASLTPGSLPFSGMNSTAAASRARCNLRRVSSRIVSGPLPISRRLTMGIETPDCAAQFGLRYADHRSHCPQLFGVREAHGIDNNTTGF